MSLESLQYLDNHKPHPYDFCIECKPTNRTCQLYYRKVEIKIIYEGTNILVGDAFLKCFRIVYLSVVYLTAPAKVTVKVTN